MKKQNKVYSASDFKGAVSAISIDTCYWTIDNVDFTAIGEFSRVPLFELQLRRVIENTNPAPNGLVDMSDKMQPNKTYYVREGRPLFNEFAEIWDALGGDVSDVRTAILNNYAEGAFRGRVESLSGIRYMKGTRSGAMVQKSKAEFWYPEYVEEGYILDDFIYLCNRGIYTPVIEEQKPDPMADAISKLDPELVKAIMSMKK